MGFNEDVELLRGKRIIKKDKDVSERTGYKKSTVSNYLSGKVPPSKPFLKKFYEVYSLDLGMNKVFADTTFDNSRMVELEKENALLKERLADKKEVLEAKKKLIIHLENDIKDLKKRLAYALSPNNRTS